MIKLHLIPLKSKLISTDVNDNLLYRENNIFLMDNHRLAIWCWFQIINKKKRYNLFHIDAHPDMSKNGIKNFDLALHDISSLSLDEYRSVLQKDINIPLFRWDNYISFFTDCYSLNFNEHASISCTHKLGSNSSFKQDLNPIYLLREIEDIFTEKKYINEEKWIVNLDLDYFFSSSPQKEIMYSEKFILNIMNNINLGLKNGLIEVLTIALSPECCGSWENAEKIFNIINTELKLDFSFN